MSYTKCGSVTETEVGHDIVVWASGFFDGEGCVRIAIEHKPGTRKMSATLSVAVAQNDKRPLDILCSIIPGTTYQAKRGRKITHCPTHYVWTTWGAKAYEFCKLVLPYSVVKHEQLQLAIKFYELPWRGKIKGRNGRTESEILADIEYASKMTDLKHAS